MLFFALYPFLIFQIWNVRNRCNFYFRFIPRIMDELWIRESFYYFGLSVHRKGGEGEYLSIINLFHRIIVSSGINNQRRIIYRIIKLMIHAIVCATTIDGNQRRMDRRPSHYHYIE